MRHHKAAKLEQTCRRTNGHARAMRILPVPCHKASYQQPAGCRLGRDQHSRSTIPTPLVLAEDPPAASQNG